MIVRNCDSYVGLTNRWVRIAIKDHDTNIKLVDKLTDILKVQVDYEDIIYCAPR